MKLNDTLMSDNSFELEESGKRNDEIIKDDKDDEINYLCDQIIERDTKIKSLESTIKILNQCAEEESNIQLSLNKILEENRIKTIKVEKYKSLYDTKRNECDELHNKIQQYEHTKSAINNRYQEYYTFLQNKTKEMSNILNGALTNKITEIDGLKDILIDISNQLEQVSEENEHINKRLEDIENTHYDSHLKSYTSDSSYRSINDNINISNEENVGSSIYKPEILINKLDNHIEGLKKLKLEKPDEDITSEIEGMENIRKTAYDTLYKYKDEIINISDFAFDSLEESCIRVGIY